MSRHLVAALAVAVLSAIALGTAGAGGKAAAGTRVTIYSSLPRHGLSARQAKAIEQGAALALAQHGRNIGGYTITYKRLDDSLRSTGVADAGRASKSARTAAKDGTTIGYIGQFNSAESKVTIPILNRVGIAQVSPANTYNGLTVGGPGAEPNEPVKYYPTGRRTYARVQPNDVVQAAALATAARDAGCSSVHLFNSRTTYSKGLARRIVRAAPRIGLAVEANTAYGRRARSYRSLAKKVHAPCVIQTGEIELHGLRLLEDVGAVRSKVRLFGGDGVCLGDIARGLPTGVAKRYRCTIAMLAPSAFPSKGRRFFRDYRTRYKDRHPDVNAIYGYESMALLLDSVRSAASSGTVTRAKVVSALFATQNRAGVLGTYGIDANGDTTLRDFGVYSVSGKRLRFHHVVRARGL
jgi:branched-chain amino acid transport system substrate-binding protein